MLRPGDRLLRGADRSGRRAVSKSACVLSSGNSSPATATAAQLVPRFDGAGGVSLGERMAKGARPAELPGGPG